MCNGNIMASVPFMSSVCDTLTTYIRSSLESHTAFAQESERPCRVYCVTTRSRGCEYLAVVIESSVKDLCGSSSCKRMPGQVHALV